MTDRVHLYLIDTNPARARSLAAELTSLSQVTVLESYMDAVVACGGLDAVFVPLMSAMEWGAIKPPAPLHQTRVIEMPAHEIARGRPRYGIPGVATLPSESLDPIATTRLVLQESFLAIYQFNETSPVKLKSIGAPVLSLGFDKLPPGEVMTLLSENDLLRSSNTG